MSVDAHKHILEVCDRVDVARLAGGELRKRNTRIKQLEDDVEAAKRSPQMAAELLATEEANIREQVAGFRDTLNQRGEDTREVLQSLYPAGFRFVEKMKGTRRIWSIQGMAKLDGFSLRCDPTGT